MFDHTAPLLVPSHMADRMDEARARRLAAEVRSGSSRTLWLTGGIRSVIHSSTALVARLHNAQVRPGRRLASGRQRA